MTESQPTSHPDGPRWVPPTLEHSYAEAVPELSLAWRAVEPPAPALLALDEELARELGLDPEALRTDEGMRWLTGVDVEPTYAQAYAGHQFGGYSPRLGDGRALLLGELTAPASSAAPDGGPAPAAPALARRDLHLKGSGRTPFSRGGDGLAAVGPMLREYVMGVSMRALGIPTTRALAVVGTGETVLREGLLPGALLVRAASSHLRVGTFQLAASTGDRDLLTRLTEYAIERHHPAAAAEPVPALALLRAVARAQAELIAAWMQVGFVHGVMNTDNMTISGETIDYGPCAFIDGYDPAARFSSIDHGGRYAYGNQPGIGQWNLARLAEALLPLVDTDEQAAVAAATGVLDEYAEHYSRSYVAGMSRRLGLPAPDESLVADVLALLAADRVDLLGFYRALAAGTARSLFTDADGYDAWAARRDEVLAGTDPAAAMNAVNPLYVPRNHVVEEALAAATAGDLAPVERLVAALRSPYEERPGLEDLARPAPPEAPPHVTFCGT